MTDPNPFDDDPAEDDLLTEAEERELAEALCAAYSPAEIDSARNRTLVALALEDPLAAPTEEEVVESERLRRALEGDQQHPAADLARALHAAHSPSGIHDARVVDLAGRVTEPEREATPRSERGTKGNVVYLAFGAAVALAAGAAFLLRPAERAAPDRSAAVVASTEQAEIAARVLVSRTTATLFDEKFEVGRTSARVDRIARARARDLRSNRYARWGVR